MITELPQELGKQTLGGHKQSHEHTRTQEEGTAIPQETEQACVCPGVSGRGTHQQWPAKGAGAQNTTVLGAAAWWHKSF